MRVRTVAMAFALVCSPALVCAQAATLTLPSFQHLQARSINSVDITIDSWPIRLASAFVEEDPELKQLLGKLDQIQVRSYEFDSDNAYSKSDVEMVRKQLSGPNWSPLVQVRSAKENSTVDICISRESGKVRGFALVAVEPRKLTILNISGSVDPADVEKLQGRLGIPQLGVYR
ncbi:MAG: DUF4252 domain-containing protein [Steroidobacter sp.]